MGFKSYIREIWIATYGDNIMLSFRFMKLNEIGLTFSVVQNTLPV